MDKALYDYLERKLREEKRGGEDWRDERDRDYDERGDRGYVEKDRRDYDDERDYDERDYHEAKMPKLTKSQKQHWKQSLVNTDGTQGEHYDMQQIMHVAEQLGLRFRDYDEKDYCLIVNWLYSDYGRILKKHLPPEKVLTLLGEMAAEWFDDPDGPEPDDKMSIQYYCMAKPYGKVWLLQSKSS